MTHEATETSNPNAVSATEHVLSPEGAARLAALTPDQKAIPTEEEPKTRTLDPAELDDKPAEGDPQADRVAPHPDVDVSSIEPLAVSDAYRADAEGYRQDAASIAREHNIPAPEVNAIFQFVGSAAAAELASAASDATGYAGQTPGPNLANPDATRQILRTKYGAMGNMLMDTAAKEFASLPADVRTWLDHDHGDGRRLSNHPALIEALALRPFARLSPDAARAEMDRIRSSKDYMAGDPLAVTKTRMLAFVISGKQPQPTSGPSPNRGIVYKTETRGGSDPSHPTQGTDAAKALRAELNKLQAKDSDLFSSDGPKRKRAIARRQALKAQLGEA